MIKKLGIAIILSALVCSLVACGGQKPEEEGTGNGTSATQTDNETKSDKKKYKNINADTKPIGVDNISIKMKNSYPYIFCTVHKNGGDLEESIVEVTLELLDENDEYIGEKTLKTSRSLCVDDSETVSEDLILEVSDEKYSDDVLSKYKATVVAIKEIDAGEAKEAEALADIMSDIEWKIKYDKEYNSALAMLEMAKEEYPNSKELKLFEAEIKDLLAKEGINMDGSKMETSSEDEE